MVETPGAALTFGIEEEFLLLDAQSGIPANRAAEVVAAAAVLNQQPEREFFSSQLETATPICSSANEAEQSLTEFRSAVARAAARCGVVLASTGLPPVGGDTAGSVTPNGRYYRILSEMRGAADHQYVTGTHVHVAVPSRNAGIQVLAHLARWAPALVALTANSPLWCGEDTGFMSWRHVQSLTWPLSGFPTGFRDDTDYDRALAGLIGTGVLIDAGHVTWVARLSDKFPTVELRIADAQLEAAQSVALAVILRALVARALRDIDRGEPVPRYAPGLVNGAIWLAARDGLEQSLIDPLTAEALPAYELVDRMLETITTELQHNGDAERVERYVRRLREGEHPAQRQRRAFEADGIDGLLTLYRQTV